MSTIKKLALTYRLYFIPVVYFTVVFGFISTAQGITAKDYLFFALIAFSAHVFGFGVNDWSDLPFDRSNPRHIRRSMLVRGELRLSWHQLITLIQFPVLIAWAFILQASFESVILVAISIILLTVYNLLGKRTDWRVLLVDLCFPLSLVFLFLAGYSLNQPVSQLSVPVILLVLTLFLSLFIANSIQGGFRDMEADLKQRASNILGVLGSRMEDGTIRVSKTAKSLAFSIYLLHIPLIGWQAIENQSPVWTLPLIVILLFFGFMDLVVMLNLSSARGLLTTDYYVATAYIFYAALVPWMHLLPRFLWVIIGINLLYPFVVVNKTHFGRQTFGRFFQVLMARGERGTVK